MVTNQEKELLLHIPTVPNMYGAGGIESAMRLWPDSEYNQNEWRRAVNVVRSTSKGWVCDIKSEREEQP